MEKETLLSGFKTVIGEPDANGIFGDTGISKTTLEGYVNGILPDITSDEMVNDAFYQKHTGFLKTIGGQIRHQNAEFAKNYKPVNQTPPTPPATPPGTPPASEDVAKLTQTVQQLIDSQKELQSRLDKEESLKTQESLRKSVIEEMKKKGASDDYVIKNTFRGIELDSKQSVEQLVEAYLPKYDLEYAEARGNGAVPRTGQQQQPDQNKDALARLKEKHQKAGKLPVKD